MLERLTKILVAKLGTKGKARGGEKYAGMSDEDVEWMKNLRSRQRKHNEQEKRDHSFKFSFESDSLSTMEDTSLLKECPVRSGPCTVQEFVVPPLLEPLDFAARPCSVPISRASTSTQQNADSAATVDVESTSSQH